MKDQDFRFKPKRTKMSRLSIEGTDKNNKTGTATKSTHEPGLRLASGGEYFVQSDHSVRLTNEIRVFLDFHAFGWYKHQ